MGIFFVRRALDSEHGPEITEDDARINAEGYELSTFTTRLRQTIGQEAIGVNRIASIRVPLEPGEMPPENDTRPIALMLVAASDVGVRYPALSNSEDEYAIKKLARTTLANLQEDLDVVADRVEVDMKPRQTLFLFKFDAESVLDTTADRDDLRGLVDDYATNLGLEPEYPWPVHKPDITFGHIPVGYDSGLNHLLHSTIRIVLQTFEETKGDPEGLPISLHALESPRRGNMLPEMPRHLRQ